MIDGAAHHFSNKWKVVLKLNNGSFIISLDFELFWGYIDSDSLERHRARMQKMRLVVGDLIDVFEHNNMKVTWSTVGMLMLQDSDDLKRVVRHFGISD